MHVGMVDIFDPVPRTTSDSEFVRIGYLTKELLNRGHRVTWWTSDFSHFEKRFRDDPRTRVIQKGWEVRTVRGVGYRGHISFRRALHHLICGIQVREAIREAGEFKGIDIFHISNIPLDVSGRICDLLSRERKLFNLDFRDNWPDSYGTKVPRFMRRAVTAMVDFRVRKLARQYRAAESFTAVSHTYLNWALSRFSPNVECRSGVFPLAQGQWVDAYRAKEPVLREEYRRRIGVSEDAVLFMFVGTVGRSYEPEIMLALPERAAALGKSVHVAIVGDGDRLPIVRQLCGNKKNCSVWGWVQKDEVQGFLSAADVCVMSYAPTATQSLPNKIFDYMAAGRPQISSLVGEAEALLAQYDIGQTYIGGDVQSFVDIALKYVFSPDLRDRQGRNASHTFDKHFSAERVYGQFADFLEAGARRVTSG